MSTAHVPVDQSEYFLKTIHNDYDYYDYYDDDDYDDENDDDDNDDDDDDDDDDDRIYSNAWFLILKINLHCTTFVACNLEAPSLHDLQRNK